MKRRRCGQDSSVEWYNLVKLQEQDEELQSSDSNGSNYSDSDSEDTDSDEEAQLSDGVKRKKLKLLRELKTHNGLKTLDSKYSKPELLFDVRVSVNVSHRQENVPFVHLTSQLGGQPVVGYPVEIQVLKNELSKTLCCRRESSYAFDRLVWKTGKRTPVYYVTKDRRTAGGGSMMPAGKNGEMLEKGKESSRGSCVRVELVFGKLLAAIV
ncbi:Holliday junction ATP-dependent DNA helicaseRuvB [Striga asiatica]|uniref:Holliday junction ATP-dependent DNA helicaseRuvB n=1 Tax=Striga asiatica TaxID=4170 RepID=A0A5A7P2H0_STRAF|nr:Holliday junction ATP-dependent DNA helicaseRuvB [Striga asiatica]